MTVPENRIPLLCTRSRPSERESRRALRGQCAANEPASPSVPRRWMGTSGGDRTGGVRGRGRAGARLGRAQRGRQLHGDVVVAAGGAAARAGGGVAAHHHAAPHHLQPAPCNTPRGQCALSRGGQRLPLRYYTDDKNVWHFPNYEYVNKIMLCEIKCVLCGM